MEQIQIKTTDKVPAENKKSFYTLENHQIKTDGKFSYCPYCWNDQKKQGKMPDVIMQNVQKLYYKKTMEVIREKDGDKKCIDELFYCVGCKRRIDAEDFLFFYGLKPDGTRYKSKAEIYGHEGTFTK